jgi:hypothetical protein
MLNSTHQGTVLSLPVILIVDDELEVRKLLREFLGWSGYAVLEAENGHHALNILKACSHEPNDQKPFPDLIITDLTMPGMSGMELIQALRNGDDFKTALSRIPILVFSGNVDQGHQWKSQVEGVIEKPIDFATLLEVVDGVVKKRD